jgi:hypothetical protein
LGHDLKMSVNESANPASFALRLVQGNGEVRQETIHDLPANTVKQFFLVAYVMVQRSRLNVQARGEFASCGSIETPFAEQIRGCIDDTNRRSTGCTFLLLRKPARPIRREAGGFLADQFQRDISARVWPTLQSALDSMDRQARVFSHQDFRPGGIARLDGVQDCFVFFKRTPRTIAFHGNHDCRWRGERRRLKPSEAPGQHRALRHRDEGAVKRGIYITEARHLFRAWRQGWVRGNRFNQLSV